MEPIVQLRAAKIPFIGAIAIHYWYVILQENQATRWEIWQKTHLSADSWGHLHKNLMPINSGVGNGASWRETVWKFSKIAPKPTPTNIFIAISLAPIAIPMPNGF